MCTEASFSGRATWSYIPTLLHKNKTCYHVSKSLSVCKWKPFYVIWMVNYLHWKNISCCQAGFLLPRIIVFLDIFVTSMIQLWCYNVIVNRLSEAWYGSYCVVTKHNPHIEVPKVVLHSQTAFFSFIFKQEEKGSGNLTLEFPCYKIPWIWRLLIGDDKAKRSVNPLCMK